MQYRVRIVSSSVWELMFHRNLIDCQSVRRFATPKEEPRRANRDKLLKYTSTLNSTRIKIHSALHFLVGCHEGAF